MITGMFPVASVLPLFSSFKLEENKAICISSVQLIHLSLCSRVSQGSEVFDSVH